MQHLGNYRVKYCWKKVSVRYQNVSIGLWVGIIDIKRQKIDCLSFVMCPLLASLVIGFFSFFFAAAVYSTNEANKAGGTCH